MEQKRLMLWIVFLGSVFMLMLNWSDYQMAQQRALVVGSSNPAPSETKIGNTSELPTPAATINGQASVPINPQESQTEQIWVVANQQLKLTISSVGASVVKSELLDYPSETNKGQPTSVIDRDEYQYMAQTGLVGGSFPNHLTKFHCSSGCDGTTQLLTLESEVLGGVKLIKNFKLSQTGYELDVSHEVINVGGANVEPQLYMQLTRSDKKPANESFAYATYTGFAFYTDEGKYQKLDFSDIGKGEKPKVETSNNGWVGMVQHYFVSAWLLPVAPRKYYAQPVENNQFRAGNLISFPPIAAGNSAVASAKLYSGPIDERKVESLAVGLGATKDYGIFTIAAKPLFSILTFFYGWFANWGWSIVGLTVLVKLVFFPLTAASYRSMARMKAVAPRIQELRERLKGDPKQLNAEMMRIYREEKINPLGGCLPVLIQIPVFIALYNVLLQSVEMRNQPWIGWITDLSVRDPFFILPVLMTATMLLQIRLNPTPPDPLQAKLMWMMPLAFSVMFFFFPAGLVLYWLVNNILSIAQQWAINRKLNV